MKLFRLLTTTAITTMAVAAMAVSASAALTATYTAPTTDAAGSVTLSGIETTAEQKTLLILNNDATNVVNTDIVQIDQDATLTSVAVGDLAATIDAANQTAIDAYEAGEKNADTYATLTAAWTASTNYYVRVGGDGTIEKYTLVVNTTKTMPTAPSTGGEEEPSPIEGYYKGDANMDDWVDGNDAKEVLKYGVGLPSTLDDLWDDSSAGEEEKYILELVETNEDSWIDGTDATEILKFGVGLPSEVDKYYEDIEF